LLIFLVGLLIENTLPAPEGPDSLRTRVISFSAATAVAVFLASAYFGAFVQPAARYETKRSEDRQSGVLVTHTAGTWYIAVEEPQGSPVVAITDEDMQSVRIIYRPTSSGDSLLSILRDAFN
jgi:hypothetical protein